MSFSQDVKDELEKNLPSSRHCQLAEMAAYVNNISNVRHTDGPLTFKSENEGAIRKVKTLLAKIYKYDADVELVRNGKVSTYIIVIKDSGSEEKILQSVKAVRGQDGDRVNEMLIKNACCKRAYLQGTFICIGSMTNPEKGYHLEFVSSHEDKLEQICQVGLTFDIDLKMTVRKNSHVLYIKEGAAIVDLLNVMGAHVSLMNMENAIILKDVRNDLNRKVNCEAANIIKSINAASRQIDDIQFLKENGHFASLPDTLKEMAEVRLANPDTPLKDLGSLLSVPVGKSGVNHRLRRLSEIADSMRM